MEIVPKQRRRFDAAPGACHNGHMALPTSPLALSRGLKAQAAALGFDFCRIVPVATAPHGVFYAAWITAERAGDMHYLERNVEKRQNPALLAEGDAGPFRSLIVLAVDYHQFVLPPDLLADPSRGIIASYAWGDDYHEIIRPQLYALDGWLAAQTGRTTRGKCLVDTGPVLERDWAQAARLGFTGKNCCTIRPGVGSWLLLATVMVPEVLAYDPISAPRPELPPEPSPAAVLDGLPPAANYGAWEIPLDSGDTQTGTCGSCTRCLDACPTNAFTGPFHLDARRCISYWTIETQAPIPTELRPRFGNRIFGCDICQEVCPWNRRLAPRTPRLPGLQAQAGRSALPLLEGFAPDTPYWLNAEAFAARFRRSPVRRAKRHGMLRNVCVALGNWADPVAVPALITALGDPTPAARGHAAWALGRVLRRTAHAAARAALLTAQATETDLWVRAELALAVESGQ